MGGSSFSCTVGIERHEGTLPFCAMNFPQRLNRLFLFLDFLLQRRLLAREGFRPRARIALPGEDVAISFTGNSSWRSRVTARATSTWRAA